LYKKLLSITDYNKSIGTEVTYIDCEKKHPIMNDTIWNASKSILCFDYNIDIMIDDSKFYGQYFTHKCQYILYTPVFKEFLKLIFYCK
jgi:hypothetical protein